MTGNDVILDDDEDVDETDADRTFTLFHSDFAPDLHISPMSTTSGLARSAMSNPDGGGDLPVLCLILLLVELPLFI